MNHCRAAAVLAALITPLAAQRGAPKLTGDRANPRIDHQRFVFELDHGVPPWGRHSLEELPVGGNWRLGMNEATMWRTEMPIVQGDTLVAPGSYRAVLERFKETSFGAVLDSAGLAVGQTESRALAGWMTEGSKPAKKLAIELDAITRGDPESDPPGGSTTAAPHQLVHMTVRYGPHEVHSEFTLIGGSEIATNTRYRLVGWSLPAAVVQKELQRGAGVPVATLFPQKKGRSQDPELLNVVVTKDRVELVPGMRMPTESFGFGAVEQPLAEWRAAGKISWTEGAQGGDHLAIVEASFDKKEKGFVLELLCGKRGAVVFVPEPKAGKS